MKIFELERATVLPFPRDTVFDFFSKAENLELLTPPWLSFNIKTPQPIHMCEGALIDYRLRVRGIPLTWRSEITVWEPPYRFVDEQRRGPYRRWIHEHRFEEADGGTRAVDHVRYAVFGGALINKLFVAPDVRRIFAYRQQRLEQLFDASSGGGTTAPPAAAERAASTSGVPAFAGEA